MMGRTPHSVTSTQFKDMFTLDAHSLQKHLKDFVDLHKINAELENVNKSRKETSGEETAGVTTELESVTKENILDVKSPHVEE